MHVFYLHVQFCGLVFAQTFIPVLSDDSLRKYSQVLISNVSEKFHYTLLPSKINSTIIGPTHNSTFHNIHFTIVSKNKVYRVVVSLEKRIYSADAIVEIHSAKSSRQHFLDNVGMKNNYLYSGYVIGNRGSFVTGFFWDGIFNGIMRLQNQEYFVETGIVHTPNRYYFNAVMYTRENINLPNCTRTENCLFGQCAFSKAWSTSPASLNINGSSSSGKSAHHRTTQSEGRTNAQKTCTIELVADHTFFRAYGGDHRAIISTLLFHVNNADYIFRQVDFDGDRLPDNLGFVVKKITIFENPDFSGYPFSGHFSNAKDYIMAFTSYRQNACLSLCFTHRQFAQNQVGIAFVPSPSLKGDYGGLCEETKLMHDGTTLNLNIAIVSTLVGGRRLPSALTSSTVVHELGHSFGSLHDPERETECSPKGRRGSYIMSPYANDGSLPNNKLFSKCSVEAMRNVMNIKGKCLQAKNGASCGDGIKESGEECDCGEPSLCPMVDPCCTPKDGIGSDRGCTFRRQLGYECSPKASQCCTDECKIVSLSEHRTCQSAHGKCSFTSACNGTSSECPVPSTIEKNACSSLVCGDKGLETCRCPSSSVWECFVCCRSEGKCVPAIHLVNVEIEGLRLPVGTKCHEGEGVCDGNSRCTVLSRRNKVWNSPIVISWLNANWQYMFAASVAVSLIAITGICCYRNVLTAIRNRRYVP